MNNVSTTSCTVPSIIKRKCRHRKKLLIRLRQNPNENLKKEVTNLNIEIKNHFAMEKRKRVRKGIIPGDCKSLWKAVNIAKDINSGEIPAIMFLGTLKVEENDIPERFAEHLESKVASIVTQISIDPNVYNGITRLISNEMNFMTNDNILKAVSSIKMKNSEGDDRIPQRIIIDGINILLRPLTVLFGKIYETKEIPEQWKLAKITPVHKKGNKDEISNYRPVANLCSASKIFERLILQRIQELQDDQEVDITNEGQHGFKRGKSTKLR